MRILVISNLYPPYYVGGYEIGCQDAVEALKARGHEVKVLTSTYGVKGPQSDGEVYRWMEACLGRAPKWKVVLKELVNQTAFIRLCDSFQPDVVFLWNLTHVSISCAFMAQQRDLPTCYYIFDNWLATWEKDHWHQLWRRLPGNGNNLVRRLTSSFLNWCRLTKPQGSLNLKHAMFASQYLKEIAGQTGKPVSDGPLIPWGLDINRFPYRERSSRPNAIRLLYVGQTMPHKGVHTAIMAFKLLARKYDESALSFTIVGDTRTFPAYTSYLKALVTSDIARRVNFVDFLPREQLPDVYHDHDILIFPSVWDEPFGIVLLEAMSCGLAVVGTGTGGSSEILEGEVNAMVFPKEDAEACAKQIKRLVDNPSIFERIRQNGRRTVEKRFKFEQTIDKIEEVLFRSVNGNETGSQCYPRRAYQKITNSKQCKIKCPKTPADIIKIPNKLVLLLSCANILRSLSFYPRLWMRSLGGLCNVLPHSLLFGCGELFYRLAGRRSEVRQIDLSVVRSIMVVQLADIGDVVLTSPFLRELRRASPHSWIGLVVQPTMYNLVEECPYVDEVFTFNWKGIRDWRSKHFSIDWCLKALQLARRILWRQRLDLAISPRRGKDSCHSATITLMYISGSPWRVGYLDKAYPAIQKRGYRWLTDGPAMGFPRHEVERQLDVLRFLKVEIMGEGLETWTNQTDEAFAEQVMGEYGVNENDLLIAFAPGAGWPKRRWPADRFAEMGKWLQEKYGAYILILGSQQDHELGLQIERGLQRELTLNLVGRTTLRQMAALLRHCKLCLANDSGPMHVAAAAGVPVVGLFGSGEYQRFKPWGASHEVAHLGLLCGPCWGNCMFDRPYCIEGITVTQIKGVISTRLNLLLRDAKRR